MNRRRLSCAIRAKKAYDFAAFNMKVKVAQRPALLTRKGGSVALVDLRELEHARHLKIVVAQAWGAPAPRPVRAECMSKDWTQVPRESAAPGFLRQKRA